MNVLKKTIKISVLIITILLSAKMQTCHTKACDKNVQGYTIKNMENSKNKENEDSDMDDYIDELLDTLKLKNIDSVTKDDGIVFSEVVYKMIKGEEKNYISTWLLELITSLKQQFTEQKYQIKTIVIISIISAFIANIQNIFTKAKTTDAAFYITILMLAGVISAGFITIYNDAVSVCTKITEFMKVLLPAYLLSVTFVSGGQAVTVYYEMALFIIWLANAIILKVIIRMAGIYMIITYINEITDNIFLKMAELIKKMMEYSLRFIITVVIGLNVVKQMSMPMAAAKKNILLNAIKIIPGVGNIAGGITDSISGAAVIVRNGTGIAGIFVIFMVMAFPIIKTGIYVLMYMFVGAIIEPAADKKMVNIISNTAQSALLVLKCILTVAVIFIITIGLVCVSFFS